MPTYLFIAGGGGTGSGVSSLNTLTGALSLVGGTDIQITPAGANITISYTGTGGSFDAVKDPFILAVS